MEVKEIAQNIAELIEADILARDDCASFWKTITLGGRMMIMGDWADQIVALLEPAKPEPARPDDGEFTKKLRTYADLARQDGVLEEAKTMDEACDRLDDLETAYRSEHEWCQSFNAENKRLLAENKALAERNKKLETFIRESEGHTKDCGKNREGFEGCDETLFNCDCGYEKAKEQALRGE